jgi:hypothetical protein
MKIQVEVDYKLVERGIINMLAQAVAVEVGVIMGPVGDGLATSLTCFDDVEDPNALVDFDKACRQVDFDKVCRQVVDDIVNNGLPEIKGIRIVNKSIAEYLVADALMWGGGNDNQRD